MKTDIDQDVYDPQRLLEAITTLIEARPVQQLQHTIETLYGFYDSHKQPISGAIRCAIEILTVFLKTLETITTTLGPVNGPFEREFNALGKKLLALRLEAGTDQQTVADAIGIELSLLHRFEQGQCGDIRLGLVAEFADHFGVPLKTLFMGISSEKFSGPTDEPLPADPSPEASDNDEGSPNP
ncbi:helix-turn-helix domain-containing protein [Dawidia soli]|uniref:Helix-turn-helix domain-containing protein n=1 Tax=Dawidia soli TaxID=2782352 RepID=A0AAP2GKU4_9BACT|nr:helix-turn-helix transcriptional regulator [Dawidia soli]MBT1689423.1 helix-turn-helix domain-containing protein [Dawidia soli]